MRCGSVKKNLSAYMDQELSAKLIEQIKLHLSVCSKCQEDLTTSKETWSLLREWKDIEPKHTYISRFWNELSAYQTWQERLSNVVKAALMPKRLIPAVVGLVVLILVVVFSVHNAKLTQQVNRQLANLSAEDVEFADELELMMHLEWVQTMDFFE